MSFLKVSFFDINVGSVPGGPDFSMFEKHFTSPPLSRFRGKHLLLHTSKQQLLTDSQTRPQSHFSRFTAARCLRNAALTNFLPQVFFIVHFLMLHGVKYTHTHTHLSHTSKCLNVTALDHKISNQDNVSTRFKQTINKRGENITSVFE